ncbi:alpha/beta fold hydrolase [Plantibacter sp. MCCC 1A11337]|uniref:alpha/beta fold hydrolase n=1 Tax=Plantibacter sp. MCCC 1A11337 TaxID=2736644 RepID=UPI001583B88D|nr:alpha/beta fold hydrolase [Plantibacter sp. MCCC 1A11337]NUJ89679.1 alpha/beta fold hydrolase [Plantibacter sp. MCCC 1A11337]
MTEEQADPHTTGFVDVDYGASIFVEESGIPDGVPALWLHGGPGGSLGSGWYRSHFNLSRYRLIGIDQRGSGRSLPNIVETRDQLDEHTTQRLIADIEAVRVASGVERWVVSGVSWGTTLALAYAQEHPDRVIALALVAVTTTSRDEVDWITEGVGRVFPEEWARFEADSGRRDGERIVEAYARRLREGDAAERTDAATAWDRWESAHVSLDHPERVGQLFDDATVREAFATLVTHYWSHDGFLTGDRAVLSRMDRIAHIPGALVHGRRDISGPAVTVWLLHQLWPASELTIVETEGHGGTEESAVLRAALNRFAALGP